MLIPGGYLILMETTEKLWKYRTLHWCFEKQTSHTHQLPLQKQACGRFLMAKTDSTGQGPFTLEFTITHSIYVKYMYNYMYHKNQPRVGKYHIWTYGYICIYIYIYGWYGLCFLGSRTVWSLIERIRLYEFISVSWSLSQGNFYLHFAASSCKRWVGYPLSRRLPAKQKMQTWWHLVNTWKARMNEWRDGTGMLMYVVCKTCLQVAFPFCPEYFKRMSIVKVKQKEPWHFGNIVWSIWSTYPNAPM